MSREDFYVPKTSTERLREIESTQLEELSTSPPRTIEESTAELGDSMDPVTLLNSDEPIGLSLADVRAAALENNLDLEVALFNPAIAETSIDEEEARFEATFTASARRNRIDSPSASTLSNSTATIDNVDLGVRVPLRTGGTINVNLPYSRTQTNNSFSTLNPAVETDANFSITQPLLRGAGVRANTYGIRVAKYQRDITTALTKLEAIRILANADRAYWRLFAARKALEVSQKQYEVAVEQIQRARRLVDMGEGPALDVTRAESGLASRLEDIIVAEQNVLQTQRELKAIMNRADLPVTSARLLVPTTDPNPLALDLLPDELAEFALANRMEMLEQELQLAIDASTIRFEKNQALPLVTLDYNYRINGLGGKLQSSLDLLDDKSFEDWSLGLNVEVPIGNEAAEARVNRAILSRVQRLATRSQRELAITQEVFDVVERLEANWQRILAARQAAILAAEVLASEQRIFDADDRTSTDVLNAAADLANAQLAEIRALTDYQIAQVDLAFATGTLLGRNRIRWEAVEWDDLEAE